MNLGRRIESRLIEIGEKRSYILERVPELSPGALSLLISRDSKRSKFDVQIAKALGVRVAWLRLGHPPKLILSEDKRYNTKKEIYQMITDDQMAKAVIRIIEEMNHEELEYLQTLIQNAIHSPVTPLD